MPGAAGKKTKIVVLHVATSPFAAGAGGGRTRVVAETNFAFGASVQFRILCFVPAIDLLRRCFGLREARKRLQNDAGCPVTYMPQLPFTRYAFIYLVNRWIGSTIIRLFALFFKADILHGQALSASNMCAMACRGNPSLKLVTDMHGASLEEYLYSAQSAKDSIIDRAAREEDLVFRYSDAVIFVSNAMAEHYRKKVIAEDVRPLIVPCAVERNGATEVASREERREKMGLGDKMVFCYVGSSVSYQLPEETCSLFAKILSLHPSAYLLILTGTPALFQRHLNAVGVPREAAKVFTVPHADVPSYIACSDAGLLLRNKSTVNQVSSPTKFGEYIACGVPVITTEYVGDVSSFVSEHGLGWKVADPSSVSDEEIAEIAASISTDREGYKTRCMRFSEKEYSWKKFGVQIHDLYFSLLR